jgi:hypothetical protein
MELATRTVSTPERWESLGLRLKAHVQRKPQMDSQQGPQRWAQLLLEWALEAMLLAYGRAQVRSKIKELTEDFFCGR